VDFRPAEAVFLRLFNWFNQNLDFESSIREMLQTTRHAKRESHSTDSEVVEKAQFNLEQVETLMEQNQFDQVQQYLTKSPHFELEENEIVYLQALIEHHRGNTNKAAELAKMAIRCNTNIPNYHCLLATIASNNGESAKAIKHHTRAIELDAGFFKSYLQLGYLYEKEGSLESASDAFEQAWQLRQNNMVAAINLILCCKRLGQYHRALDTVECIVKKPDSQGWNNSVFLFEAGFLMLQLGFADKALKYFEAGLALDPQRTGLASAFLYTLNLASTSDIETIFRKHKEWPLQLPTQPDDHPYTRTERNPKNKTIRLGFVSPDFFCHPISCFLPAFLKERDPQQFEIYCYSNTRREDEMTCLYQNNSDKWVDIAGLGTTETADIIRNDEIDILIDLTGHTTHNRLDVFHLRAAPTQMSFLGYPNTTGVPNIDYRITDEVIDPPSERNRYSTEKLLRIPGGMHCYQPVLSNLPDVGESPCKTHGYITFGSFNNHAKLSDPTLTAWKQILDATPNSRLRIKSIYFEHGDKKNILAARLQQFGFRAEQYTIISRAGNLYDHLKCYQGIDISLDTFPYNGTTTTCDSLIMGVPVVSHSGDRPSGRTGASLLKSAGLDYLCATNEKDYIDVATAIASDPLGLGALRKQLRTKVLNSTLCDTNSWTRKFENILLKIFKECNSIPTITRT